MAFGLAVGGWICLALPIGSAAYQINWQGVGMAGGRWQSANYRVINSAGWAAVERSQSANYGVQPGFVNGGIIDVTPPGAPTIASQTHPDQAKEYANNAPAVAVSGPSDVSGIAGYHYLFDQIVASTPGEGNGTFTANRSLSFTNVADGTWYLHAVAKDGAGNVGTSAAHFKMTVKTAITPALAGEFYADDGSKVNLPANTLDAANSIEITAPANPPAIPYDPGIKDVGKVKEIRLGNPAALKRDITVTMAYTDAEISGMREENLKVSHYDDAGRFWKVLFNSVPDPAQNKVAATVNHLSLFRLVAYQPAGDDVSEITNYPNPLVAGGGRTTKIRYTLNVTSSVELRIYDLIGKLVWERKIGAGESGGQAGPNEMPWDGKNGEGHFVAAGGYICVVKAGGAKLRIKIGVK